ncbi:MAG: urea ABC transporter permease subunit UrtB, partial [Rhizobiales bacterium]|nr:urea ABC transporter permease subunit UrtB [Hyphomicrobiales bacterium]
MRRVDDRPDHACPKVLPALIAVLVALIMLAAPGLARADIVPQVNALGQGDYAALEKAVGDLAATGDPAVPGILEALGAGDLYVRKSDNAVVRATRAGSGYTLTDPATGADLGEAGRSDVTKIKVNNKIRGVIRAAAGSLTLMSADPAQRLSAAAD